MPDNWYGDDKATLGDRIGVAREHAELSVETLARKLGIRPKTVDAWENDEREPRAHQLRMLAGLTGASLIWLLSGQGENVPGTVEAGQGDTQATLTELRALQSLMDEATRRLARLEQLLGQN